MRARASKGGLTLSVIAGSNNALLAMDLDEADRKGCLGFSIERTDLESGERRWLPNMIRFPSDPLDPADVPAKGADSAPTATTKKKSKKAPAQQDVPMVASARAPLQTFRWGDYTLDPGKRYRY